MPPGHARSEVAKGWTGLIAKLIQQQGTGGTIVKHDPFTPGRAVWRRLGRARSGVRLRSANLNN